MKTLCRGYSADQREPGHTAGRTGANKAADGADPRGAHRQHTGLQLKGGKRIPSLEFPPVLMTFLGGC